LEEIGSNERGNIWKNTSQKIQRCPKCKSKEVVSILWNCCALNPEHVKLREEGKAVIRGGIVMLALKDRAKWFCKKCLNEWK
jgi:hypothetical protein